MEHACTRHEPSTTCYRDDHCRCDGCRSAVAAYSRARRAGLIGSLTHHAVDLDEIAWLLEMGETPQIVASRMGSTVGAIAKNARRRGRPEIARPFERVVWAERRAA